MTVATLEIVSFFTNVIFFLNPQGSNQTWFMVVSLFHPARGFCGIAMSTILPHSHQIVSKLDFAGPQQLKWAQVRPTIVKQLESLLVEYLDDWERPAKIYTLLSAVTLLFDIVGILVYLIKFGMAGDDFTDLPQFIVCIFFLALDLYLMLWTAHLKMRLPE